MNFSSVCDETMSSSAAAATASNDLLDLLDEEIECLSMFMGLMENRRWDALCRTMLSNPAAFRSLARSIAQSSGLNGMTMLHACVRFDPPLRVVKMMIKIVPESPRCTDCMRRTPLHVAAGTRASPEVIQLLVSAYPAACAVQDVDSKTPLHMACDSSCELFENDARSDAPPSFDVVATLIKGSPRSVPLEDGDGMSALEYAIFSDAHMDLVKLLQYATRRQTMKMQEGSGSCSIPMEGSAGGQLGTPSAALPRATLVPATSGEFSSLSRMGARAA